MTRGGGGTNAMRTLDVKVGLGRSNPNSSKFGRERRGKKKKGGSERACGMRRY